VDVQKDRAGLEEMLKHSRGSRKVPVIVDGKKGTIGYGGS
jgi:glutaredoxin